MSDEIAFWEIGDDHEQLYHTKQDEAIEDYLDAVGREQWPAQLELCGYRRRVVSQNSFYGCLLEKLLEDLDEEYGGDGSEDLNEATESMKAAEKTFIDAVVSEYRSWQCEVIARETVPVLAWVTEHRPDWLEVKS